MPIYAQSNMFLNGNVVDIVAYFDPPSEIYVQPGTYVEVPQTPLAVRKGVFSITVSSLDKDVPTTRVGTRSNFNCLPLTIEVFKVGEPAPIASATTKSGPVPGPTLDNPHSDHQTKLEVDAGPVDETHAYRRSKWTVRLTNNTDRVAAVAYQFRYIRDTSLVTEAAIPLSVLNNAFSIVLKALAPAAHVRQSKLTIQISPEIAEYTDSIASDGAIVHNLSLELPIDVDAELVSLAAGVVAGADVLAEVDAQWAAVDAAHRDSLASADTEDEKDRIRRFMDLNDKRRDYWHATILPNDVAVRVNVALSDILFTLSRMWTGTITLAEIVEASARLYLVFKRHGAFLPELFGMGHAIVFTGARWEGALAEAADFIGIAPDIGQKLEEFANQTIPKIHRYFAEALIRMVHSPYQKRYIDSRIEGGNLIVRFCDDPADPGALPRIEPATGGSAGGGAAGGGIHTRIGDHIVGGHAGAAEPIDLPPEPVGVLPEGFNPGSVRSVQRLDNIDTIVVVMMENRSFDHMLGRLSRKWPEKGYRCYPDGAANIVPGQSPIKMVPARNVQIGRTYLAIDVDPYHGTKHVKAQINGGAMDGFARDIMTKPAPIDRRPQVPLTYYEEADIPFLYYLAENYMVCDMWFPAHPGGTYPNRWALLSGTMPGLSNFPADDPQMGFVSTPTIFDHLTNPDPALNIEWIYYESNIGMLRMYGRYRLDGTRVLPYDDPNVGFKARAAAGTLPPVVFIEPRITGIPPLAQASDDHPPANILRGQDFLRDVYTTLKASPQWAGAMLVITYDEHGGFYDHVPPPGTPFGDPAWVGGLPKIHPDGETYLGARVPTFIVSPFVTAGSVSHATFDHTSIIKTILVRHRMKIRRTTFGLFGERVPKINHLGVALNRAIGVTERPSPPEPLVRTSANFGDVATVPATMSSLPPEMLVDPDEVPYAFSLARAMMPKRLPGG